MIITELKPTCQPVTDRKRATSVTVPNPETLNTCTLKYGIDK